MSDETKELSRKMAKEADLIIGRAITQQIGDKWSVVDLQGRLTQIIVRDSEIVTYELDGKPILEMHPIELEFVNDGNSFKINATMKYRNL